MAVNPDIVPLALMLLAALAAGGVIGRLLRRLAPERPQPAIERPDDDLSLIKGIGEKLHLKLKENGIARFEQIAGWSEADIERIERSLSLRGRVRRDDWVGQARLLADAGGLPVSTGSRQNGL